jgi:hypothetical protein
MHTLHKFIHKKIKTASKRLTTGAVAVSFTLSLVLAMVANVGVASAAQITTRSVTVGSSVASASTTYAFSFVLPSSTVVKSIEAVACTTASGACSTPSGFSASSSTLTGQPVNLGDASGWTVNTGTAGKLRALNNSDVASPTGTTTISWSSVTNPSASNSSFFMRISTYSDSTWTTPIDTGTVAAATAGQITVTASVDETLTFTLSAATVALGTLTTSTTGSGTSTMTAATNAASGYVITVAGTTLTSGANTITALAANAASSQASSQFGINLVANATPSVGTNVSGSGSGAAAANYNTADSYRFVTGETVASAAASTNSNTYTVSYIANIAATTKPGSYSTALTYTATPTF